MKFELLHTIDDCFLGYLFDHQMDDIKHSCNTAWVVAAHSTPVNGRLQFMSRRSLKMRVPPENDMSISILISSDK